MDEEGQVESKLIKIIWIASQPTQSSEDSLKSACFASLPVWMNADQLTNHLLLVTFIARAGAVLDWGKRWLVVSVHDRSSWHQSIRWLKLVVLVTRPHRAGQRWVMFCFSHFPPKQYIFCVRFLLISFARGCDLSPGMFFHTANSNKYFERSTALPSTTWPLRIKAHCVLLETQREK